MTTLLKVLTPTRSSTRPSTRERTDKSITKWLRKTGGLYDITASLNGADGGVAPAQRSGTGNAPPPAEGKKNDDIGGAPPAN